MSQETTVRRKRIMFPVGTRLLAMPVNDHDDGEIRIFELNWDEADHG